MQNLHVETVGTYQIHSRQESVLGNNIIAFQMNLASRFYRLITLIFLFIEMSSILSAQGGCWMTKKKYPMYINDHVAFQGPQYGYVVSGTFISSVMNANLYNPYTDSWSPISGLYAVRANRFSFDTCAIILGGDSLLTQVKRYSIANDTYYNLSTPGVPIVSSDKNFTFVIGSKGYIASGANNDFYCYDLNTDTWTLLGDLPYLSPNEAIGFCVDSFGYYIDGLQYTPGATVVFHKYNPSTDTWTSLTPPPFFSLARNDMIGFSIGKYIYVGGGFQVEAPLGYQYDFYQYNTQTDTWTRLLDLPPDMGVAGGKSFVLNNHGYIVGGKNDFSWYNDEVYMFTPSGLQIDSVDFIGGNCPPFNVNIYFTACGSFSASTITAELSDSSGSFSSPTVIGSTFHSGGFATMMVSATIPLGVVAGTGYRVRVTCASPSFTSNDNGTDITVLDAPVTSSISGPTAVSPLSLHNYSVSNHVGSTYTWDVTNGTVISGAGTNAVQVQWGSTGTGNILVTEDNGICQDTSSLTSVIGSTLLDNENDNGILIYPNPASNSVTIKGFKGKCSLTLLSIIGKTLINEIFDGSEYSLNINGLPKGVYTLQLMDDSGTKRIMLVIE